MGSIAPPDIFNLPAKDTAYFTPAQNPVAGTALIPQPDGSVIPKLFTPITIRSVTFQNRIFVGNVLYKHGLSILSSIYFE